MFFNPSSLCTYTQRTSPLVYTYLSSPRTVIRVVFFLVISSKTDPKFSSKRAKWWGQALFRSYGCFFAEFLGDPSLVRLTLLELTTCVGCGTDYIILSLEIFLGSALCCINLGRTLNLSAPLSFLIKERSPDLPGNHNYGTDSNPIMSATYCTPSSHRK